MITQTMKTSLEKTCLSATKCTPTNNTFNHISLNMSHNFYIDDVCFHSCYHFTIFIQIPDGISFLISKRYFKAWFGFDVIFFTMLYIVGQENMQYLMN